MGFFNDLLFCFWFLQYLKWLVVNISTYKVASFLPEYVTFVDALPPAVHQ